MRDLELAGTEVGLRERDSVVICTRCMDTILVNLGEKKQLVAYVIRTGDGWQVEGVYCNHCEPHGGDLLDPTPGVDEAIVFVTIKHHEDGGTGVVDWEVIDKDLA